MGEVEEKWLVAMTLDKVTRLTGKSIGQVCLFFNWLTAAHDGIIRIVSRLILAHVSGIDQLTISAGEAAALVAG